MAKKKTSVARIKNQTKQENNSYVNWLIGIVIVVLVAVIGIVVVNFSDAANAPNGQGTYRIESAQTSPDGATTKITFSIDRNYTLTRVGKFQSGAIKWKLNGQCYTVASAAGSDFKSLGTKRERYYDNQQIVATRKTSCNL